MKEFFREMGEALRRAAVEEQAQAVITENKLALHEAVTEKKLYADQTFKPFYHEQDRQALASEAVEALLMIQIEEDAIFSFFMTLSQQSVLMSWHQEGVRLIAEEEERERFLVEGEVVGQMRVRNAWLSKQTLFFSHYLLEQYRASQALMGDHHRAQLSHLSLIPTMAVANSSGFAFVDEDAGTDFVMVEQEQNPKL